MSLALNSDAKVIDLQKILKNGSIWYFIIEITYLHKQKYILNRNSNCKMGSRLTAH